MASAEPPQRLRSLLLIIGATSLSYAVVRYHLIKGVAWSQLPLYTLNKAVSLASLELLAAGLWVGLRARAAAAGPGPGADARRHAARRLGLFGAAAALWHSAASVVLLTPHHFPSLFSEGGHELTAAGGVAVAAGATALAALACLAFPDWGDAKAPNGRSLLVRSVLLLTGLHTACIGFPGWLTPLGWPGGLPPITLLSSAIALGAALMPARAGRQG